MFELELIELEAGDVLERDGYRIAPFPALHRGPAFRGPLGSLSETRDLHEADFPERQLVADFGRPLGLSSDEIHAWTQDLRDLGTDGRYFFSLNRYLFLAVKPTLDRV